MNQKDFSNTKFHAGMQIVYKGDIYELMGVDFELGLFGIDLDSKLELTWLDIKDCNF